jgi:hypothetical protein
VPGRKHPVGQLQKLTIWLLEGPQLQLPIKHELGKSAALVQQLWVLTSPPVAAHSAASDDAASLTPPSAFGHSPSDFFETRAWRRSHSFP